MVFPRITIQAPYILNVITFSNMESAKRKLNFSSSESESEPDFSDDDSLEDKDYTPFKENCENYDLDDESEVSKLWWLVLLYANVACIFFYQKV